MKKVIILGLLIMAFAATSYAQDAKLEFRASGFIDEISEYWKNNFGTVSNVNNPNSITNTNPAGWQPFGPRGSANTGFSFNEKEAFMESRLRLKFDAVYGKELSGTIFFEADSALWGDTSVASNNRLSDRNGFGYWSGDRAALEIKNVYIDAALPYMGVPIPMQLRIGLQSLSIRPNLLIYTDGMGAIGSFKVDPVNLQFIWFKALEGRTYVADDVDVWGFHGNAKIDTFTLGGYAMYYNMDTFPLNKFTTTAGFDTSFKSNMWWLGLYADGQLGPVNINFDAIYDTGKVKKRDSATSYTLADDVDYSGWAGYLKVDYPWDMFNFGLVSWYGSGNDANKSNPSGLPTNPKLARNPVNDFNYTANGTLSRKVNSFVNPPGSESGAVFGESLVMYSCWVDRGTGGIANGLNYNQMARGPIGGTWAVKGYGMYKATPWYKLTLQALYIGDTTTHGDTFGNARNSAGNLQNNSSIGWEVDLYNEFQIYKQLKFWVAGGYMWPGNAYKFWDPVYEKNRKPQDPWTVMTNLTYTF